MIGCEHDCLPTGHCDMPDNIASTVRRRLASAIVDAISKTHGNDAVINSEESADEQSTPLFRKGARGVFRGSDSKGGQPTRAGKTVTGIPSLA